MEKSQESAAPAASVAGKKVFVIEDDLLLASIIVRHLTAAGIATTLISSGDKAFEAIKKDMPDAIVLDIFLPGLNGLDLLAELRKDETTRGIKVVVVSNTDQKSDRTRATGMGANFLLKAAVTPQQIVQQVAAMLV